MSIFTASGDEESIPTHSDYTPGIDFKADGGYVIAQPSIHKSGKRYSWKKNPPEGWLADSAYGQVESLSVGEILTTMPEWLGKLIDAAPGERSSI